MDNDAHKVRASSHFTEAMLRALDLAVSASIDRAEPSQIRDALSNSADLFEEGIRDAATVPIRSNAEFEDVFALVDTLKAVVPRRLIAQRSAFGTLADSPVNTVLMSISHPSHIRDYFHELKEATVILSLCLRRDGMVSAFVAQYYPPDGLEYTRLPLVIPLEGAHFNRLLDSYAASIASGRPDMGVLDTLLSALSRGLVVYFSSHELPSTIVIIPHRLLHIIPWHMVQLPTEAGLLYLPSLVRTIAYASSLREVLSSNVWLPAHHASKNASADWVAVLDEAAGDLPGLRLESQAFGLYKRLGLNLEIVSNCSALPVDMTGVSLITWSGHAWTHPSKWGGSYVVLDGQRITAEEIMARWVLRAGPTVMLASCTSSIDMSSLVRTDEYCGLDMAFRIAGARAACGTIWPVTDHTAAIMSVMMAGLVTERRKGPAEALTFLQRGLISGTWRHWRPSRKEVDLLAGSDASLQGELERMHEMLYSGSPEALADPREWASFRCLGV